MRFGVGEHGVERLVEPGTGRLGTEEPHQHAVLEPGGPVDARQAADHVVGRLAKHICCDAGIVFLSSAVGHLALEFADGVRKMLPQRLRLWVRGKQAQIAEKHEKRRGRGEQRVAGFIWDLGEGAEQRLLADRSVATRLWRLCVRLPVRKKNGTWRFQQPVRERGAENRSFILGCVADAGGVIAFRARIVKADALPWRCRALGTEGSDPSGHGEASAADATPNRAINPRFMPSRRRTSGRRNSTPTLYRRRRGVANSGRRGPTAYRSLDASA